MEAWLIEYHRAEHTCLDSLVSLQLCSEAVELPSPDWKAYSGPSGFEIWFAVSRGVGGMPLCVGYRGGGGIALSQARSVMRYFGATICRYAQHAGALGTDGDPTTGSSPMSIAV